MSRDGNSIFTQEPDNSLKSENQDKDTQNPYRVPHGEPLQVKDVSHDPLGLDIPTELVPLPSQGLIYPPGHPLHNCESVEIHPMTAREEDILTTRAYLKKGTVMTELLKSCLIDKRIDPDDLILGDKSALMVAIRVTGYGPEYSAEISCPSCNEKFRNDFDLSSVEIKQLGINPKIEFTNEFEFVLPMCKRRVVFRLMTSRDESEMSQTEDRRKKLKLRQIDTTVTMSLLQSIISVDGVTDRAQISKFVNAMPALDSRALRNYMSEISPNVDMTQKVICPHCDVEADLDIPMTAAFFWPDMGK